MTSPIRVKNLVVLPAWQYELLVEAWQALSLCEHDLFTCQCQDCEHWRRDLVADERYDLKHKN